MVNKRAHILVYGRVQGVYYRSYAEDEAQALGLTGWVRNRPDGRVEAILEGEETAVREMIDWAHKGSPSSRVDKVDVAWETPTGEFYDFHVSFGY
ncbi:MAG: acylphosphatase [Candidatus Solincola sediminis]|uniref:acylphosphatase n=1 Tax=Candidatus Solincola sediminis TaxID=1797199 RepID=A0A1F2WGU3_9ACTN|nr:MAG: acylphosphatase [Candidatus Solincola sediminis]OFW58306.1 MAG: acylphosphatase [Candidatus Solincola sediminis]